MVKSICFNLSLFLAALLLSNCNLEVGNPEPTASGFRSPGTLSFNLSAYADCESTAKPCTAAPIILSTDQKSQMSFEMTTIALQLSRVELKPAPAEEVRTQIDLLNGTHVALKPDSEARMTTGVALCFEGQRDLVETLILEGNLVVTLDGKKDILPLTLTSGQTILAEAAFAQNDQILEGVTFDANVWFDFSASLAVAPLLQQLAGSACRTAEVPSCSKYRDNLARLASEKISKSMSIKSKPTNTKSVSKGKIGG